MLNTDETLASLGLSRVNTATLGRLNMETAMQARSQRIPRLLFFIAGGVLSGACFWFQVAWLTVANRWFGLGVNYDTRPQWFAVLMALVLWLPWIVLGICVVLRVLRGSAWHPLSLAAGLAVPYAYVFASLFLMPAVAGYWHQRPFDQKRWIAQEAEDPDWPERLCMADDLVASGRLQGLTKAEVLQLLGPANDNRGWPGWELIYWLGPERGFVRIDSEWLAFRFGSDGRVTEYRIVRD